MRHIFDTTYKGGETGQNIHVRSTSRIDHIPKKQELFCYVPDNDIKGTSWDVPRQTDITSQKNRQEKVKIFIHNDNGEPFIDRLYKVLFAPDLCN